MKNPIYSASPSGSQQSGSSQTKSRLGLGIVIGLIVGLVIAGIPAGYFYMNYSSLNSKYSTLESNYSSLQSNYSYLQSIVSLSQTETLENSQTISQPAGYYTYYTFNISYAGYITVDVSSSTTSNTWVEIVGYSSNGISYNSGQLTVGYSGTVSYPVLPGTVQVEIGNSNLFSGATETVTITYTY